MLTEGHDAMTKCWPQVMIVRSSDDETSDNICDDEMLIEDHDRRMTKVQTSAMSKYLWHRAMRIFCDHVVRIICDIVDDEMSDICDDKISWDVENICDEKMSWQDFMWCRKSAMSKILRWNFLAMQEKDVMTKCDRRSDSEMTKNSDFHVTHSSSFHPIGRDKGRKSYRGGGTPLQKV